LSKILSQDRTKLITSAEEQDVAEEHNLQNLENTVYNVQHYSPYSTNDC